MEWGEFRLGDLFEKLNLKFLKSNFDKEKDVSKEKTLEFDLPLVNAKNGDNGIMYYGKSKDFESAEMTIDIVGDGAISTGNVYSQPQKTGVLYNAYLVKLKFKVNEKLLHFFTSVIQKSIKLKFGYENKAGWEKVKEEKIHLPTKAGKIDFAFMESFIAELEAERIAELEAYLLATGLRDYTLTDTEVKVLRDFESGKFKWNEWKIGELFDVRKGKRLPERVLVETKGNIALINQSSQSNMIARYSGLQELNEIYKKNAITFGVNTKSFSYQKSDFYTIADVLFLKSDFLNEKNASYFTTIIKKQLPPDGWDKIFGLSQMKDLFINVPTQNSQPNYELMNIFISAIQKLVIKDVVLYADRKIAATKSVVGKK